MEPKIITSNYINWLYWLEKIGTSRRPQKKHKDEGWEVDYAKSMC